MVLRRTNLISQKKITISGSKSISNRLLILQSIFPNITIKNQTKEIIKVNDNPPQAPVSTQFNPSSFPNSISSS